MKASIDTNDGGQTFEITDAHGATVLLSREELNEIIDDANAHLIVTQELDEKAA